MSEFNSVQWNGGSASGVTGVSVTAGKLVHQALRSLGVLYGGQVGSADVLGEGLELLNQLVDSWNTERLLLPAMARNVWDLRAGQADYALGPGGDFDCPRPETIEAAGIIIAAGATPAEGRLHLQALSERAGVVSKSVQGVPAYLYDDGGFPLRNLSLYPVPSQAGMQIAIYASSLLEGFADLETEYVFGSGYALALRLNLAVLLAPEAEIHQKISSSRLALLVDQARRAKGAIKRPNSPRTHLRCDAALIRPGRRSIITGFDRAA